jgi:hypothetical protein
MPTLEIGPRICSDARCTETKETSAKRSHEIRNGWTPADRRLLSDQPTLRQRHADAFAHDDVIEKPDIDERERLLHPPRDEFVRLARLGHARRMVVSHDHRRRVLLQRELHDFPGMHARPVDRPAEQLLELDEAMALIEINAALIIYWVAI